jgi:hypothetical protein
MRKGILTIQHLDVSKLRHNAVALACDTFGMMTTLKGLIAALHFLHIPSINN